MSLVLQSSGGGTVTLQEPATASNFTATFPAVTGTVVTTGDTGSVTPTMMSQKLTLATAQNSTSGTSIDFTGIPSWAKRVTLMFNNVSTNGTSTLLVQVGAGSVQTTSYSSFGGAIIAGGAGGSVVTTGFPVNNVSAATSQYGSMIISLLGSNVWTCQGAIFGRNDSLNLVGGAVALSGALDRVRITTIGGTDAFDAGSINIMYEG